jgi:hypothetical protein
MQEETLMSSTQPPTNESSKEIKDFRQYIAGKEFPPLKKTIHILIVVGPDYIVFLDEKLDMHLWVDDSYGDLAEGFGAVLARQADLEATSTLLLKEPHLEPMRRMLAEAIGRLLDDRSVVHANHMLNVAAAYLRARSLEQARIWYLRTMLIATSVLLILGLAFWKNKVGLLSYMALSPGAAEVIIGLSLGSLGALLSVLLRLNKLPVDPSAGPRVHYFEGVMRVLVGALAGAIFIMAVKTNILLSSINGASNSLTLMMLLSIVAGASEQLLPNLISRFSAVLDKQKLEIVVEENAPAANASSNGAGSGPQTEKFPHDDNKQNKKKEPASTEIVEK